MNFVLKENGTKLLKVATEGNEAELRKLIACGKVYIEFTKQDKNTAAHLCSAYGYTNCLKLLLNMVLIEERRGEEGRGGVMSLRQLVVQKTNL
jgi:hypothetical protein